MMLKINDERPKNQKTTVFQKVAFTRREAAEFTGVTYNAICEAVSTRKLKARKKGRNWIIMADDLSAWLRK